MEKLLRFVEEPDVGLFDNVVAAFYQGTPQQVRINKNKKKKSSLQICTAVIQ